MPDLHLQMLQPAGVELASGFYEFLKRACNSSISWQWTGGDQINTSCLEKRFLEKLDGTEFEGHRATTWQYYQNVVTVRQADASQLATSTCIAA